MGYMNEDRSTVKVAAWASFAILGVVALVFGCIAAAGAIRVWWAEQAGRSEYAQAEANRRIAVLEAEAKMQAARSLAGAEIERAKGVAEANKIIGESLRGHESYLRYLWIMALEHAQGRTVVYVPTEANLPILEASRLEAK